MSAGSHDSLADQLLELQSIQEARVAAEEDTRLKAAEVSSIAKQLARRGLLRREGSSFQLTDAGRTQALEMVRAHRLWESYLSERANVPATEVHEQAERLEHVHGLVDEVDETLGHPRLDPHGEVIPRSDAAP